MTEYSYDSDDYRFEESRDWYNYREDFTRNFPERVQEDYYQDRPEIKRGVDVPEDISAWTEPVHRGLIDSSYWTGGDNGEAAMRQDAFDDDMSRIRAYDSTVYFNLFRTNLRSNHWF